MISFVLGASPMASPVILIIILFFLTQPVLGKLCYAHKS